MKKVVLFLMLFLTISSICYAGEWRKKYRGLSGNDVWEYKEDNYRATFRQRPLNDLAGHPVYEYQDNEGNRRIIRQSPFNDLSGSPIYRDSEY